MMQGMNLFELSSSTFERPRASLLLARIYCRILAAASEASGATCGPLHTASAAPVFERCHQAIPAQYERQFMFILWTFLRIFK
jgi:hypothetical protein